MSPKVGISCPWGALEPDGLSELSSFRTREWDVYLSEESLNLGCPGDDHDLRQGNSL